MKVFGQKMRETVVDLICDRCKKSCLVGKEWGIINLSYAELNATWPFGSPKDTERHQLHMCEKCYDWLRKILKDRHVDIRVTQYDLLDGSSEFD